MAPLAVGPGWVFCPNSSIVQEESCIQAKKYLLAQEEATNLQDLIAFLERMIPNLDELIEQYEEKNQ